MRCFENNKQKTSHTSFHISTPNTMRPRDLHARTSDKITPRFLKISQHLLTKILVEVCMPGPVRESQNLTKSSSSPGSSRDYLWEIVQISTAPQQKRSNHTKSQEGCASAIRIAPRHNESDPARTDWQESCASDNVKVNIVPQRDTKTRRRLARERKRWCYSSPKYDDHKITENIFQCNLKNG